MADIKRRVEKLETQFVPKNSLADKTMEELDEMLKGLELKQFGRTLNRFERERLSYLIFHKNMNSSEINEKDLLPTT